MLSINAAEITVLKIKPSKTDASIKQFDTPHLIMYNPEANPGKLLLFLPGTNGKADNGLANFFKTALEVGYRVISLCYIDTPSVSVTCNGDNLAEDMQCAEAFREKRIFGKNTSSLIPDEPQDAIMNRFIKLLLYLAKHDRSGKWDNYIENGQPKWSIISVCGQSQGGGMAAYIAKKISVARVIDFSGGWDHRAKRKIANWYFSPSVTPMQNWFAAYNVNEPNAKTILETYNALSIPEENIYPLNLGVDRDKAHVDGIRNPSYKKIWIEMLGSGRTL